MFNTYEAVLQGDTLCWEGSRPRNLSPEKSVKVHVTVLEDEPDIPDSERGPLMAAILAEIAQHNELPISDPVAWQKEIRKDRPLVGREDE